MADDTTDPTRGAADAFRRAGERARDNGNQISVKLIEQAERNTREVFAAMRAMAQAGNVAEMMRIQGEFVRDQTTRAVDQARELGELITRFGQDAAKEGGGGQ